MVTTPSVRPASPCRPEWAPHACCWMAWPCRPENWDDIEKARATYVEVARAVARFEPVTMTANAEDAGAARGALAGVPGADVVVVPSDDSWARDTAPTFVTDGRGGLAGVDWRFNAYGGIYEEYGRTRDMARRILDLLGARRFAAPLVLEGGAVHVDGEGTVLTTTEVVLDPRRNPASGATRPSGSSATTWAPRRSSGSARRSTTTTPAATWTTSPASPRPGSSRRSAAPTATTPSTRPYTRTWRGCARRPTPAAARSRWSSCPCRRVTSPAAPALAQLRQLLRRQRRRRDARLRRPCRRTRRATSSRASSPAARSSRSPHWSSPWRTATSTASPSSSPSPEDETAATVAPP